ncbi:MAG: hypothetical protein FDX30_06835 [Chlorobium sp.]|nr:MAG: hypothetical protein FDX30_06835 [Chlorobium sp.]
MVARGVAPGSKASNWVYSRRSGISVYRSGIGRWGLGNGKWGVCNGNWVMGFESRQGRYIGSQGCSPLDRRP